MADKPLRRGDIRPIKERIEDELLRRPGVVGVDINEKRVKGEPTGRLSIVVYVEEKKPKGQVPKDEMIPAEIEGIPTDVQEEKIELQAFVSLTDVQPQVDTTKYTPLRGGISMGPCRSIYMEPPDVPSPGNYLFTGTLGAMVKDRSSGQRMALTNFHVACVDDSWSVGDTMCQPSRVDGGSCPSDRFGTLTRAVLSEDIDGAVVTVDSSVTSDCSIEEIGAVKGKTTATVGMAVRKRGRTTELTHGSVDSVDVSVSIDYGDGLGTRTLKHQIRIVPDTSQNARFSDRGDSGSVVVDANNKVIGLLFAGTTSGSATFLNPIDKVLDQLDVDLCVKPTIVLTKPVICGPLKTSPITCRVTKPVICDIISKPIICEVVTFPTACHIRTVAACPPRSLACGLDGRPPIRPPDLDRPFEELYGQSSAEAVDDAFWLGYYTALENLADAEAEDEPPA